MKQRASLTKKELRQRLNISQTTLARLLNCTYFEDLKPTGYRKTQKILLPKQLDIIEDFVGIEEVNLA